MANAMDIGIIIFGIKILAGKALIIRMNSQDIGSSIIKMVHWKKKEFLSDNA